MFFCLRSSVDLRKRSILLGAGVTGVGEWGWGGDAAPLHLNFRDKKVTGPRAGESYVPI